jgi:NAD+ kinase
MVSVTPAPDDHTPAPERSRCFGLAVSQHREPSLAAAQRARAQFEKLGAQVFSLEEVMDGQEVEALIAVGGDGTLLHSARLMAPRRIPVLGVNFGRVGYLCAAREEQLEAAVEVLVAGRYRTEERSMLRCRVFNRREEVWQVDALNEILIGGSNRTLLLELSANRESLGQLRGDGLIVSTRTGSTAYAFSAGGPILLMEGIILVASNPIASSIAQPVVVPTSTVLNITNQTHEARPYVIADGQKDYQIEYGTEIEIVTSPLTARLVDPGFVTSVGKLRKHPDDRL